MEDWKHTQGHHWDYCRHCECKMIICGKCGNNCCNAGYGTLPDGSECDECPKAYDIQRAGWAAE